MSCTQDGASEVCFLEARGCFSARVKMDSSLESDISRLMGVSTFVWSSKVSRLTLLSRCVRCRAGAEVNDADSDINAPKSRIIGSIRPVAYSQRKLESARLSPLG